MTGTDLQDDHLKKAQQAEALAEAIADPAASDIWKRIAIVYRDLAHMQAVRTGRLFR